MPPARKSTCQGIFRATSRRSGLSYRISDHAQDPPVHRPPDISAEAQTEFVQLLTSHQSLIHSFVLSLVPHSPDVEDIVQEINLVLWKKRGDFEPGTNFKAWALTVSRYQVMAYRKKMALRRTDRLTDEILGLLARDAAEQSPEFLARHYQALRNCFQKLPRQDRELLLERYWHKTPLREFAALTGRTEQALKSNLHRLRHALRRCVKRALAAS